MGEDVKRLAASFVVACRDNGLKDAAAREIVRLARYGGGTTRYQVPLSLCCFFSQLGPHW